MFYVSYHLNQYPRKNTFSFIRALFTLTCTLRLLKFFFLHFSCVKARVACVSVCLQHCFRDFYRRFWMEETHLCSCIFIPHPLLLHTHISCVVQNLGGRITTIILTWIPTTHSPLSLYLSSFLYFLQSFLQNTERENENSLKGWTPVNNESLHLPYVILYSASTAAISIKKRDDCLRIVAHLFCYTWTFLHKYVRTCSPRIPCYSLQVVGLPAKVLLSFMYLIVVVSNAHWARFFDLRRFIGLL